MIQLACLVDGGLCIVAFTLGTFVVGWVGKKVIHSDCEPECEHTCDHTGDEQQAAAA
jgi:hypothetical protein